MSRRILLLALVVVLTGVGAPSALADGTLTGNVGSNDAFVISLGDANGNPVTRLDPGTYTLTIHDHSAIHSFHLVGPGVDVGTTVPEIGDKTFTITLTAGTYNFHCDAHPSTMKGSFTVGAAPPPPPPPPPPKRPKLLVHVAAGGHIALRLSNGAALATLKHGTTTIVVTDASAKENVRLAGPGVSRATGLRFHGTVTWKVTLKAGRYVLKSDGHKALARSFNVR